MNRTAWYVVSGAWLALECLATTAAGQSLERRVAAVRDGKHHQLGLPERPLPQPAGQ